MDHRSAAAWGVYRHKKFDEQGNNTEVALIEPKTGMLVKVAVREFAYYE